jgi:hypothetical protein
MTSVWTALLAGVAAMTDLSWALPPKPTLVSSHHRRPSEIQDVVRAAFPKFRLCYQSALRN